MKTKRILAILMGVAISMSLFIMPTPAADIEESHNHDHIEIIFEDENLSPELKEKATAYFLTNARRYIESSF